MSDFTEAQFGMGHSHVFLGAHHDQNEKKTWAVIGLCSAMMIAEIAGGSVFGSLALVADGLHMSTHASAMLIAALAYTYARKHANDRRFVFGTGKLGDLAGFTSAIILAMIALLIGYEAVVRFLSPVPIHFGEAIPIAVAGLVVNIVSAWLLRGDDHHHGHGHGHQHAHGHEPAHGHAHPHAQGAHSHAHGDEVRQITVPGGVLELCIYEEGVPPVFRLRAPGAQRLDPRSVSVTTVRPGGIREQFVFADRGEFVESTTSIPEPHAFEVYLALADGQHRCEFTEHEHPPVRHEIDARDHNIRAAYVHVMADAAISVLAIVGLSLARNFGWLWMDPLAGIVGALVIANWSYGLIRDTGAILVDISPGEALANQVRTAVETAGDRIVDLHVWRLGPGHFGAVVSIISDFAGHGPAFYHAILRHFQGLSHITVEVHVPQ